MSEAPTLVCGAMPFGYGPAAKLLTLAPRLRRDWRLGFVGRGAALELVLRRRDLFDEVRTTGTPAADRLLAGAHGALSIMDRELAAPAQRARVPLVVVDSLLWMRPAVPEALAGAELYLAQDFPGLEPARYAPRPRVVGPLIPPEAPRRRSGTRGLVVNLGGSAAPDGRHALYAAYARLVALALRDSGIARRFPHTTLLGGSAALHAVAGTLEGSGIRALSVSHDEAQEHLAHASVVVTAPGLTATLACFASGTPTWLLPPQNYSQWCILKRLRAAGAAASALHWEDLPGVPQLFERMQPAAYEPVVQRTVRHACESGEVRRELAARIGAVAADSERAASQRAFVQALGPNGVEGVARAVHDAARPGAARHLYGVAASS